MRRLKICFLVGSVALATLGVRSLYLLRQNQTRAQASDLLASASRAEAANHLGQAAEFLSRYLRLKPEDPAAWASYARVMDRKSKPGRGRESVYQAFQYALRFNEGDRALKRRVAEIALELGQFHPALRLLTEMLEGASESESAELHELIGRCHQGERQFDKAERAYRESVGLDPKRVACFDRLARMLLNDMKSPRPAEETIEAMVRRNPTSAQALVARWRYRREFGLRADAGDIAHALELAPDDGDVLLAEAELSSRSGDLVRARRALERGAEKHPDNAEFHRDLARLELADNHPDRAEAVLVRGIVAAPEMVELKVLLVEALLAQGKLEGGEGAAAWIDKLKALGLADGHLKYLLARLSIASRQWETAAQRLEVARTLEAGGTPLATQIDLLLAECYRHQPGGEPKRLAALRRAAATESTPVAGPILAAELEKQGRLDEAIKLHTQLMAIRPESSLDQVRLLILKTSRMPRDERPWPLVEDRLRAAEAAVPRSVEALTLLRADLLEAEGRPDDARGVMKAASARDGRNVKYRIKLAHLAMRQARVDAAAQILEQAERDLGPCPDLRGEWLRFWSRKGGAEGKAAVARIAGERDQVSRAELPDFLGTLARAEEALGELQSARGHWGELVVLEPGDLMASLSHFDLSLRLGDLPEARKLIERLRETEGRDEGTAWRFAEASLRLEQYRRDPRRQEAEEDLEAARTLTARISELWPDGWTGPILSGQIAELEGTAADAIEHYARAIRRGCVQPALAPRLLASTNGRADDPKVYADLLVRLLREHGFPADGLAILDALDAVAGGDAVKGITLARQVLPESSRNFADHLAMGRIYAAARRSGEAVAEFRHAVELAPGVPETWIQLVRHVAALPDQANQVKAVIDSAARALPADRVSLTLARCWESAGDAARADDLFQKVDLSGSRDPASLRILVRHYLGRGRFKEAEGALDRLESLAGLSDEDRLWVGRTRPLLLQRRANADQAQALPDGW